jgi:hypothetical protein
VSDGVASRGVRRKTRKNRKIAESTLQHHEEWRSEGAIAGVCTMAHADHDDVLDASIAA